MPDEAHATNTVIVGAGHAASEVAVSLRQKGYTGRLLLLGEEPYQPYQRPPLSKGYLSGEADEQALYLKPTSIYEKLGIDVRTSVRVVKLDPAHQIVTLADGAEEPYDKLILATGGRPRPLSLAHEAKSVQRLSNLHYLRTIDDVNSIRRQFKPGFRLAIIGGGYIGLEVAAIASRQRVHVTVLEALPRVLARVTAPELSAFYEQVHREAGVDIRTSAQLERLELDASGDAVKTIVCADGTVLTTDFLIVGIGLIPNVELAQEAGLTVDNGIAVDQSGRTSDPNIFAIGDCSSRPSALYGRRVRLESVPNALEQARSVAAALCGQPCPDESVPWFWSDQYDLKLQMAGLSHGYDTLVVRGKPSARSFIAFYLKEGRIIAADAVNSPAAFMLAKRVVAKQPLINNRSALADETIPLQSVFSDAAQ
ncbi:pyridine nucleotide-disulfide oxidoreductase, class I [Caballeronia udeis]|uniref:Pyridine nucleotide-disulfide oxidoreductase, class I n=1 Tax=Caballeronia udeis TaxID=1232866 RepID=A0A158GQP5_9BURK|nr:FAD-dependent oxidoreductase [Caballeronia udeis]SAL34408.1 pyridine nucleotide-disulfide oxidoreductase, class I [Caballeronia udeis]